MNRYLLQYLIFFIFFIFFNTGLAAGKTASLHIRLVNGSGENLSGIGFVQLFDPQMPMRIVGEKTVQPEMIFDSLTPSSANPYLIRILYEDISYSVAIFLKESRRYDTSLTVYSVRSKSGSLGYSIPHWFLFIHPDEILFEETIEINNPEPFVILPSSDTLNGFIFSLPDSCSLIDVSGEHDPMAASAKLTPTKKNNNYSISFPIRPGVSKIHLRYFLRRDSGKIRISRFWHQNIQSCNLLVFPAIARLTGDGWDYIADQELENKNYALYKSGYVPSKKIVLLDLNTESIPLVTAFRQIRAEENIVQQNSLMFLVIFIAIGLFLVWYIHKKST